MNVFKIAARFPDQEACSEHLERVRFSPKAYCPHCGSFEVARKSENDRVGRWNCHDCKSSFNVLSGTIFAKSKIPLQKWFMAIGLMLNAKKSLSSPQLSRDIEVPQKACWYMQQRIRAEMTNKNGEIMLHGIIEADETYVGGKPRKRNKRDDNEPKNPRGRATKKTPVIGAVERGGKVVAQVAGSLSGRGVMDFLRKTVDPEGSVLITDEYRAYRAVRGTIPHAVIKHSERYADGLTHTNTIEGFWSLLKRAWYGTHHHYREHYTPLYVGEASWKYNERRNDQAFGKFLAGCFA